MEDYDFSLRETSENFGAAPYWIVMFSPTKVASDRKGEGEELDERKWVYLLCGNLSPDTEPKLLGDHGQRSRRCHILE